MTTTFTSIHTKDPRATAPGLWWMLQVCSRRYEVAAVTSTPRHGRPTDDHGDGIWWGYSSPIATLASHGGQAGVTVERSAVKMVFATHFLSGVKTLLPAFAGRTQQR